MIAGFKERQNLVCKLEVLIEDKTEIASNVMALNEEFVYFV